MIKWLLGLVLAAGLYVASAQETKQTTVEKICEVAAWDCSAIVEPTIIESLVVLAFPGYYGFHFSGERFIFIHPYLPQERKAEVITHETVHYVIDQLQLGYDRCAHEESARSITRILHPDIPYNDRWKVTYGCN